MRQKALPSGEVNTAGRGGELDARPAFLDENSSPASASDWEIALLEDAAGADPPPVANTPPRAELDRAKEPFESFSEGNSCCSQGRVGRRCRSAAKYTSFCQSGRRPRRISTEARRLNSARCKSCRTGSLCGVVNVLVFKPLLRSREMRNAGAAASFQSSFRGSIALRFMDPSMAPPT
jgi:hypothetical protein